MIQLYFQSIDKSNQLRHFDCQFYQLETALDTLNLIAVAGNTLLDVYFLEDGKRTSLSPQAFDGSDLLKPIRSLQRQWEAILTESVQEVPSLTNLPLIELLLQQIDQFESRMAEYDSTISKLERLLAETQQQLQKGGSKDRLVSHYQLLIHQQQARMAQAQANRDKWLKRLTQSKQSPESL